MFFSFDHKSVYPLQRISDLRFLDLRISVRTRSLEDVGYEVFRVFQDLHLQICVTADLNVEVVVGGGD
ncbi:hypothetical protein Hanom_Chr12g01139411 [Helianthus anomalus]